MKRLRFVLTTAPRVNPRFKRAPDTLVSFAPMDALADGLGGLSELETKSFTEVAGGSYNYFENGDVLLAKVTPCFENGKKAIAHDLENGAGFATSEVLVFRPDSDGIDTRYLHYLFCAEDFRHKAIASMTGAGGLRRVSERAVLDFPLRITDLATQRQIADFLDRETARIDLLIEKKKRFIETLSESRLTAAPSVIRGFGGPEMKETPDTFDKHFDANGWSVGRVKHIVKLMTSGSRGWSDLIQDDGELFLQSGNIGRRNEIVLSEAKRIIPQTNAEARRTRLKDADTLVCITGGRTGAVGFLETVPETAYINQHICLLRPEPKKIYPKLLAQSLYSEIGQRQFSFFQYGLKQGLGFSQVGEVRLPIPPQDLQPKISSEIDRIFERIGSTQSLQERSIDRLKEYRSALITAAVTGQIAVTTYAKSGTPDRRLDVLQEEMGA